MERLRDSGHRDVIERVVREDATRIVATLIRKTGSIDRAEDALQEALTAAVTSWATSGVPMNPPGWLMAVAQRKAIDVVEPLDGYRLVHAARGELLRRLERREDALSAYERALELTTNRVEQAYIRRRRRDLS